MRRTPVRPMHIPLTHAEIRSWRESDAESLVLHANNARVAINLRDAFPHPYALADAHKFIQRARSADPETVFAIAVDGKAVGGIGIVLHEDVERVSAEIGYWLGEPYWGRGIMTEAVRAVTAHAVATHGLTRVYAVPFEGSAASCRVLEKAGFVLEGRLRKSTIKAGKIADQWLYAWVVPD